MIDGLEVGECPCYFLDDNSLDAPALREIAAGDGIYGAQAHEYKQIARNAIARAEGGA